MPKQRFNKLSEEKRERIRQGILRQLSETTLDNFSIKKMMAELGIDRRNFLFYFNGIDDMVGFALQDYWEKEEETYRRIFVQESNIEFLNIIKIISELTEYAEKQQYLTILKNISLSMKISVKNSFELLTKDVEKIFYDLMPRVYALITRAGREIKNKPLLEKFFSNVISMCILIYRSTLSLVFCDYDHKVELLKSLNTNLEIIETGVKQKIYDLTEPIKN